MFGRTDTLAPVAGNCDLCSADNADKVSIAMIIESHNELIQLQP